MKDGSGLAVIVLALLLFVAISLFRDRDPRRMNPRLESDRGSRTWEKFQLRNFLTLALSFLLSYLLIWIFLRIWPR